KLNAEEREKHPHYNHAIAGQAFIPHLRAKFTEINNAVLKARGIQRKLDPRRYEEMGITRTPTLHLGTRAAALEAMGVPTVVGRLNAIAIWGDAERAIRDRAKAVHAQLNASQVALRKELNEALTFAPEASETKQLRRLVAERDNLVSTIADDRLELMIFDHLEAKAKSRAVRTRYACLQTLTEAQRIPGSHSKDTVRAIERRYGEAQAHIEKVDHELSFDRPRVAAAAAEVLRREQRIHEIDRELAALRNQMQSLLESGRALQARAKASKAKSAAEAAAAAERQRLDELQARIAQTQVPPTVAKPTVLPVATTPSPTPVAPLAAVASMTPPSARTDIDHGRRPRHTLALTAAYWRLLSARELASERVGSLGSAPALSRVRGLSSSPVVRDDPRPPVLLRDLQGSGRGGRQLCPERAPGDELRRAGEGHPGDARSPGEGSGLTPADDKEAVATPPQPLAPPAIGGVPIVVPVLPVTSDALTPPVMPEAGDPEGLQPLRPQPVEPTPQVEGEDVDLSPIEVEGTAQPHLQPTDPSVMSERADQRRKVEDPTLPVTESVAPTKPAAAKASYEDWDALITKIARQRIAVLKDDYAPGKVRYTVPGLGKDDTALVANDRFAARSASRLAAIFEQQDREISRLIRWIEKNGQDPKALIIEGRTARIGKATDSVVGLLNAWRNSERVKNALRAEHDRRQRVVATAPEASRDQSEAAGSALASPARQAASNQARLAELARMYPDPEDGRMPQTRQFIKLLREDASPEELKKAAEAVAADPVAREDVYRHKVELALAYDHVMADDYLERLLGHHRNRGRD
ncbi:MAG: MobA/MobL family protein, partial [Novosphingobium sp.]